MNYTSLHSYSALNYVKLFILTPLYTSPLIQFPYSVPLFRRPLPSLIRFPHPLPSLPHLLLSLIQFPHPVPSFPNSLIHFPHSLIYFHPSSDSPIHFSHSLIYFYPSSNSLIPFLTHPLPSPSNPFPSIPHPVSSLISTPNFSMNHLLYTLSILINSKDLMQGKLIAVAYTLRTY